MTEHQCSKCAAPLTSDEIALFKKLVSREAEKFLCLDCFAAELSTTREKLEDLIEHLYQMGTCI
ncbi:MAG: hypothetical protein SOY73_16880 [Blautia sp.]|nr:hypothetical protein [Blautia sp.]MDY4000733.1 hypothetical protein [Blautia sp.]